MRKQVGLPQDESAHYLLDTAQADTVVHTLRCRPARRTLLSIPGTAWDPAIDGFLTWYIRVNGTLCYPYNSRAEQMASPYRAVDMDQDALEIPNGATVEIIATLAATYLGVALPIGGGTIYTRLRVKYEEF